MEKTNDEVAEPRADGNKKRMYTYYIKLMKQIPLRKFNFWN